MAEIITEEHWALKGDVRLYLREKYRGTPADARGTILFVHGSAMGLASFDFALEGRPHSSVLGYFAELGYDAWALDCEGFGRSDSTRDINCDVSTGADDLEAVTRYITGVRSTEQFLLYGISSGALRAALFAQRYPERVKRQALEAFVWTGEGSPTLAERRKRLAEYQSSPRRPLTRALIESIFSRDHPGTTDERVVQGLADAVLAVQQTVPNGTYVDMCARLPLVDPTQIRVPTLILRGEHDGIASMDDLLEFFKRLPVADKHFSVMPGISHGGLSQRNYLVDYHLIQSFFGQPEPVYVG